MIYKSLESKPMPVIAHTGLVVFAALVWAGALVNAVYPGDAGFIALRLTLLLMTGLWIVALLRSRAAILVLSPLLILATVALLGYSIVEAVYAVVPKSHRYIDADILAYTGSLGEALVLQFVAFCLFVTASIARFSPIRESRLEITANSHGWATVAWSAAALIGAMLAIDVATALLPALKEWRSGGLGKQIGDSIEPLSALAFASLAHAAAVKGGRFTACFFGLATFYLAAKTAVGLVQMPVTIIALTVFYYLLNARVGARTSIIVLVGAALVSTAVLFGIVQTRHQAMSVSDTSFMNSVKIAVWAKVVLRQGRSASCYDKIVTNHRPQAEDERPFYFAGAIVPRVLWPDKPALSLGHEYTVLYCGSPRAAKGGHYELVTLLAEPVLRGGWPGLAAVQLFMGLGLALVAFAMPRCRPLALITIIALLPWFVHFQQSFALYFASIIKMLLYMLPGIVLLQWWRRRNPSATANESG